MSLFRRPLTHRSQWQFKKGQWCLWPLRFDRTPWLLQRVHEGLRSFLMRISFSREDSSMFFLPEWTFLRVTPPNIQTPTEGQVEWHELQGEAYFTRWKFHWHLPVRFKNSNHDWAKHHVHVPKLTWMSHWSHSKLRLDLSVSLFSSFYRLHKVFLLVWIRMKDSINVIFLFGSGRPRQSANQQLHIKIDNA